MIFEIQKLLFEYENCYFNSLRKLFEFGIFYLSLKIGLSLLKNLFEYVNWYLSYKLFYFNVNSSYLKIWKLLIRSKNGFVNFYLNFFGSKSGYFNSRNYYLKLKNVFQFRKFYLNSDYW